LFYAARRATISRLVNARNPPDHQPTIRSYRS
jgi:hypothetical protein